MIDDVAMAVYMNKSCDAYEGKPTLLLYVRDNGYYIAVEDSAFKLLQQPPTEITSAILDCYAYTRGFSRALIVNTDRDIDWAGWVKSEDKKNIAEKLKNALSILSNNMKYNPFIIRDESQYIIRSLIASV